MGDEDRSWRDEEPPVQDTHDIGDTGDVGDTDDIGSIDDILDDEALEPVRYDFDESIDEDDLTMVDPVCGNRVEMTSLFSASYRGRTYIFDTQECLDAFLANPEVYIAAA